MNLYSLAIQEYLQTDKTDRQTGQQHDVVTNTYSRRAWQKLLGAPSRPAQGKQAARASAPTCPLPDSAQIEHLAYAP